MSRKKGTTWEDILNQDKNTLERLLSDYPNNINARRSVDECLIHMLFSYESQNHLNMGKYLIK